MATEIAKQTVRAVIIIGANAAKIEQSLHQASVTAMNSGARSDNDGWMSLPKLINYLARVMLSSSVQRPPALVCSKITPDRGEHQGGGGEVVVFRQYFIITLHAILTLAAYTPGRGSIIE